MSFSADLIVYYQLCLREFDWFADLVLLCLWMYVCLSVCMYVYLCVYACMSVCMYACVYVYLYWLIPSSSSFIAHLLAFLDLCVFVGTLLQQMASTYNISGMILFDLGTAGKTYYEIQTFDSHPKSQVLFASGNINLTCCTNVLAVCEIIIGGKGGCLFS
jgi:hypothetical protein